jgi:glycosyltransferase involved in cell wall biosynthesis
VTADAICDAVVIGRNEGARLQACLASLQGQVRRVIYVDSGSADGSIVLAQTMGATAIALDLSLPFTAARARNTGLAALTDDPPEFVQFIDGDCALRDGWVTKAVAFLQHTPQAAVACGRRRELFPEASLYNRLCDDEWDTPLGEARACGGDALIRYKSLIEAGGYRADLIAGEEPELCVRLRQAGWTIWRLDTEMTWHDAAITRFAQWFKRARRAGHAFAEGAALHGAPPEFHWAAETRRAMIWGGFLPLFILLGSVLIHPALVVLLALYPAQVVRLALKDQNTGVWPSSWVWQKAFFLTLSKLPEALGVLDFKRGQLTKRRSRIIEYK